MGLGQKIKNALSSDHDTTSPTAGEQSGSSSAKHNKTPGSFPSDEIPQKHADGKEYTPPHGTALNDATWKETANLTGAGAGATSGTVPFSSSGTQHNRLSKGPGDYDSHAEAKLDPEHRTQESGLLPSNTPLIQTTTTSQDHGSKGAYWGDMSQGGQGQSLGTHQDLPERTRSQDHRLPRDEAVEGGTYNQHSHVGFLGRDPTENSHFGGDGSGRTSSNPAGTAAHHDHHPGPSGAGIHQSTLSSGNTDHSGSGTGQTVSAGHSSLSSGSNYNQQDSGIRGEGAPTPQHDRIGDGHGRGLAGAGAAAAGCGSREHSQNKHHAGPGQHGNTSGGVPRSSMLDPEPAFVDNTHNTPAVGGERSGTPTQTRTGFHDARSPAGAYTGPAGGYSDPEGMHGPHSSRVANAMDPRVDSDRDHRGAGGYPSGGVSGINTNAGAHAGLGSSGVGAAASPTQSASSGSGRKHFGPGHEGAKVLHFCEHCGRDNDISQYFHKDVVYRLGQ